PRARFRRCLSDRTASDRDRLVPGLDATPRERARRIRGSAGRGAGVCRVTGTLSAMAIATSEFRHVGRPRPRADAPERVTGRTRFPTDLAPAGALHARFVRSPYASARIVSIDGSAALKIPGVVAVLSARDLPVVDPRASSDSREIVLAFDRVVHVGHPVAAVVAETEA